MIRWFKWIHAKLTKATVHLGSESDSGRVGHKPIRHDEPSTLPKLCAQTGHRDVNIELDDLVHAAVTAMGSGIRTAGRISSRVSHEHTGVVGFLPQVGVELGSEQPAYGLVEMEWLIDCLPVQITAKDGTKRLGLSLDCAAVPANARRQLGLLMQRCGSLHHLTVHFDRIPILHNESTVAP